MCDCDDSSDFSDDQNRALYSCHEKKLRKLNFTNYESYDLNEKKLECAVFLIDFDAEKLSVGKQNDNIYQIFYDGKPFRIATKAFSAIVKKSKVFAREKKIKVKDPMISNQLWCVMYHIERLVRIEEVKINNEWINFLEPFCVYFEPDKRFALNHIHYSEDCVIAFDQVVKTKEGKRRRDYRLMGQVIDCQVAF